MNASVRSVTFRKEREKTWFELEELVDKVERRGVRSLDADELERLPMLYRATLSSLSTARSISLDTNVVAYLDSLCNRAYLCVYGARTRPIAALKHFFAHQWPAAVWNFRWHLFASTLVFTLGFVVAWVMVLRDPEFYYAFIDKAMAGGRDPSASTEMLRQVLFDTSPPEDLAAFASFLLSHNAKIGMMCFALGFAAGVPVFYLLFYNGLSIGAMTALYDMRGLGFEWFSWILPHGVTEIGAILLCGGAGFAIGQALVFAGDAPRWENMIQRGRDVGPIVVGAVIMFFIAAFIEGFFRQLVQSVEVRYTVAIGTAIFWFVYFGIIGRREAKLDG